MREDTEEQCIQIKDYIEANGGGIASAIQKLGLQIHPMTFRRYAKARGFDYKNYEHAFERYGHWMLLPCTPKEYSTADYKYQAICTKCSNIYEVSINNLRAGASTCCIHCAAKEPKKRLSVQCKETGEVYASLRSACKKLGQLSQYKRIRLRLLKQKEVSICDYTFVAA